MINAIKQVVTEMSTPHIVIWLIISFFFTKKMYEFPKYKSFGFGDIIEITIYGFGSMILAWILTFFILVIISALIPDLREILF